MSRRHKEHEIEEGYKPQAESQVDGSLKIVRHTKSMLEFLGTVMEKPKKLNALRKVAEEIAGIINASVTRAVKDQQIVVDDEWVKIPRSYFEDESFKTQEDKDVPKQGRGRRLLSRLINNVADSKIVKYAKDSYKAVKKKCVELYENTTQFASCFLKAVFEMFAPDDDPYGKLSYYHSLIEHELPGLKGRKQLNNYYRWFVNWKPAVTYESPKAKIERFKHRLWEKLIDWICEYLQKIAPQYVYAYT